MSFAVVAAADAAGCEGCEYQTDFKHHLKVPGVHLFTADWCGHCRRMKEGMKGKNMDQPIAYHEHEEKTYETLPDGFDVRGYPTIYFVHPNGQKIEKWEGARTKDDIDTAYGLFLREP